MSNLPGIIVLLVVSALLVYEVVGLIRDIKKKRNKQRNDDEAGDD